MTARNTLLRRTALLTRQGLRWIRPSSTAVFSIARRI